MNWLHFTSPSVDFMYGAGGHTLPCGVAPADLCLVCLSVSLRRSRPRGAPDRALDGQTGRQEH